MFRKNCRPKGAVPHPKYPVFTTTTRMLKKSIFTSQIDKNRCIRILVNPEDARPIQIRRAYQEQAYLSLDYLSLTRDEAKTLSDLLLLAMPEIELGAEQCNAEAVTLLHADYE